MIKGASGFKQEDIVKFEWIVLESEFFVNRIELIGKSFYFSYSMNLFYFFPITESLSFSSTIEPASYLAPYFDMDVHRNITVTIGQTAFLHCRVERLGDKDVSTFLLLDIICISIIVVPNDQLNFSTSTPPPKKREWKVRAKNFILNWIESRDQPIPWQHVCFYHNSCIEQECKDLEK